jgi:hypothetical protein
MTRAFYLIIMCGIVFGLFVVGSQFKASKTWGGFSAHKCEGDNDPQCRCLMYGPPVSRDGWTVRECLDNAKD